ncbi:MAG: hypothetical protein J0I32_24120 [Sphingobacteriales bacterium]|nr:hypothetical protein [Sphingobacteriales bacterium]OJW01287.1 MAG: hypothetical protein BGO52_07590 [Sphingobacteriales bacterium 44-61]
MHISRINSLFGSLFLVFVSRLTVIIGSWQDWPHFKFFLTGVEGELLTFSEKYGEDGNGKIGRAIVEKAQRSNEITPWVEYFVKTTLYTQIEAEAQIDFTLKQQDSLTATKIS